MGDTLLDEQHRILKLGQVLKSLNLSHSSKLLLEGEDTSHFKDLFFSTLEDVNRLSKFLLLPECQIDKENVFKTLQLFLEQQQITGNIKEDLNEFTRYVALDSVLSQLMTLRLCFWRDPTIKRNHEIYAIGRALEVEEREPVKILEGAKTTINEMKSSLPPHCIEPMISTPISTEHHTLFDEINTQFKEEYARLKLRYVESFDRSFRDMMSGVSDKHEKYLRVKQERARVKIESSFSLWDTYNARWDLVTDLSRCALRRRGQLLQGKVNTADTTNNTNEENTVKTHVENIQVEHVVTKAQKKYLKTQQAKQKKKDQKKRRKLKELGLLDTEEEKRAEAGEDNDEEVHDNEDDENDENKEDTDEPQEPKKKNRNKSEKQERRLKKKSKKDAKAATVAENNSNNAAPPPKEEPTTAPLTKAEKKKQKFVVVVGDDGGVDVGEKN
jgi:hypothetical protein